MVRVDVLHRHAVDHDNLVFGAAKQANTRVSPVQSQSARLFCSLFTLKSDQSAR